MRTFLFICIADLPVFGLPFTLFMVSSQKWMILILMLLNFLILPYLCFLLFKKFFQPEVMKIFLCIIFWKVCSFGFPGYIFNQLGIDFVDDIKKEYNFTFLLWITKAEKSILSSVLRPLSYVKCTYICESDSGFSIAFHRSLSMPAPTQHCPKYGNYNMLCYLE